MLTTLDMGSTNPKTPTINIRAKRDIAPEASTNKAFIVKFDRIVEQTQIRKTEH